MKIFPFLVTFFVTVLSVKSEKPSSRLFQGKEINIFFKNLQFVLAESEPVDLGLVYDFFTNDESISGFQASSIAQVSHFYCINKSSRSLLVLLQCSRISHINNTVDLVSWRRSAHHTRLCSVSSTNHPGQSLQRPDCRHHHCYSCWICKIS